jgi:competence protein ComEC
VVLAWWCFAWLAGTAAAATFGRGAWPLAIALAALPAALALWRRDWRIALMAAVLPLLFAGAVMRHEATRPAIAADGAAAYNDGVAMRIRAVLRDDPDARDTTQRFAVSVRAVQQRGEWVPVSGGVLVWTGLLPRYRSGDVLELEGRLESPPFLDGFDYAAYLARKDVQSVMAFPRAAVVGHEDDSPWHATVLRVRRRLSDALALSLPEPQASLAQGVLLGQRSALPRDLADDLNATNTSHLVVVSGSNVVLVSAFAMLLLTPIAGRRRALALSIAAVVAYAALIGLSPPVLRAVIMGIVMVAARVSGRRSSAITALLFAAAIMAGIDPQTVRDVSFQLSFAATAGIMYLAGPLRRWCIELIARALRVETVPRAVDAAFAEPLSVTLAAIAATTPLLALNFGRLSLVAIPANVLVVPAFPFILLASLAAALGGLLPVWRLVAAAPAYYLLTYWIEIARRLASLPHAAAAIDGYSARSAAVTYVAIAALAAAALRFVPRPAQSRRAPGSLRLPRAAQLAACALPVLALAGSGAWVLRPSPPARLEVTVLDVGQGDAILVRAPGGTDVLVDGGPGGAVLRGMGEEMPWYDRSIEMVVLPHPQTDGLGLLEVLRRYDVRHVLVGPGVASSTLSHAWADAVREEGRTVETAQQGMTFELGGGVRMEVLGPDAAMAADSQLNNTGVVLRISLGETSFLLTADIQADAERALLADGVDLHATVLKVPHHGSRTSSTRAFLDAVKPSVSVVSAGVNNPFGHPAPDVVARLREYGEVYVTARSGAVHFETDGHTLSVRAQSSVSGDPGSGLAACILLSVNCE